MATLDDAEIERTLSELECWERDHDAIVKEFERGDFAGSAAFTQAIVGPADDMNHHPDLVISWGTVRVAITTHSEGGLTSRDFELAKRIDELA